MYSFLFCGTPVAGDILVDPSVKFKAIEPDALLANGDFRQRGAHFQVETVAVHAEIAWRVAEAEYTREMLLKEHSVVPHRTAGESQWGSARAYA